MKQNKQKIFVVVPTIREKSFIQFYNSWLELFDKHGVTLVSVWDGDVPTVIVNDFSVGAGVADQRLVDVKNILGEENNDLFYNFSDSIRNVGFAYAAKHGADIIISLDDDVLPEGDTIQDHIDALAGSYPVSWMNTTDEYYMRGFPYVVRSEAECVLSHGGWSKVPDFDGKTQMMLEDAGELPAVRMRKMPVPRGVLFPMCIMNVAFKAKLLPWMYQAPAYGNIQRFSDIWTGIVVKELIDSSGWCAVTGYAMVEHQRASNSLVNTKKEAEGILLNEVFWNNSDQLENHPYFINYREKKTRWFELLDVILNKYE